MRAGIAVLSTALLTGCFVEATGGLYAAKDTTGTHPTYGFGLAAGVYLDPGPVRVQLGGGADFVKRSTDGMQSLNAGGSSYARLDVNTGQRLGTWWPLRATVLASLGQGGVSIKGSDGKYTSDDSGGGWMAFAGLSTGLQANNLGLWLSLGPSVVSTHSDMAGDMFAVGPQLRVTLSGVPRGLGALYAHAHYTPTEFPPQVDPSTCKPHEVTECRQTFFGPQCHTRTAAC